MGIDSRIRAGASGRLVCPPFSGSISSKSLGKESSRVLVHFDTCQVMDPFQIYLSQWFRDLLVNVVEQQV